jgi:hypothetical protein
VRLVILIRGFFALGLVTLFVSPLDACGRRAARVEARREARHAVYRPAAQVAAGQPVAVGAVGVCNGKTCR